MPVGLPPPLATRRAASTRSDAASYALPRSATGAVRGEPRTSGRSGPPGARHRDEGVRQDHGAVERGPARQQRCPVVVHGQEPARVAGIAEGAPPLPRARRPGTPARWLRARSWRRPAAETAGRRPPGTGFPRGPAARPAAASARRTPRGSARPKSSPPARSPGRRMPAFPGVRRQHLGAGGQTEGLSWNSVRLAAGKRSVGRPAWSTSDIARGSDRVRGERRRRRGGHDGRDPGGEQPVHLRLRSPEVERLDVERLEDERDRPGPVPRLHRARAAGRCGASAWRARRRPASVSRSCRPGCAGRPCTACRPPASRRGPTSRPGRPGPFLATGSSSAQREIDALLDLGAEPCPWTGQREQGPEAEDRPGRSGGRPRRRALRLAGRTRDERRDGRDREMPASHAQPNLTVGSGGVEAARTGSAPWVWYKVREGDSVGRRGRALADGRPRGATGHGDARSPREGADPPPRRRRRHRQGADLDRNGPRSRRDADRGPVRRPPRPQDRAPGARPGRGGSPVRPGHRFRDAADRAGRARSHPQPGGGRLPAGVRGRRRRPAGRLLPPRRDALLPGVQAGRRAGGDPELRGGDLDRQLLGERLPVHPGALPGRPARLPQRRRRHRHHPQVGVRHQALRGRPRRAHAGARWLRAPSERGRLPPDRARLRGEPDGSLHRAPAARAARACSRSRRRAGSGRPSRPGSRRCRSSCRSPTRRGGRRSRSPSWSSRRTAGARTATPGSPRTRPSAGRWTSWSATAAPACSPRPRRSTARSTSSSGVRSTRAWPRS